MVALGKFLFNHKSINDMKNLLLFFFAIVLFNFLFSCIHSNTKNTNDEEISDINIMQNVEVHDIIEIEFNISKFKFQLDSFLLKIECQNCNFQLDIDTINEKTDTKILWHFGKWGLFNIINSKETSQLVLYHFFDPKTSKVLRIYIIEASYNDSITFDKVYQSFLKEQNRKIDFDISDGNEKESILHFDYGLTRLNYYVIFLDNKIYWLNVSSQYSKKNFNTIIDYFKDNLNDKNYIDTIKCIYN
jgi:hypothetical protein